MLKQVGTNEYEITPLILDEVESERLEALMKEYDERYAGGPISDQALSRASTSSPISKLA